MAVDRGLLHDPKVKIANVSLGNYHRKETVKN